MMKGYELRQTDKWKRTRSLEYTIYCALTETKDRVSIYEYMPLDGDPTEEEIKNQKSKVRSEKAKRLYERTQKVMQKAQGNKK